MNGIMARGGDLVGGGGGGRGFTYEGAGMLFGNF